MELQTATNFDTNCLFVVIVFRSKCEEPNLISFQNLFNISFLHIFLLGNKDTNRLQNKRKMVGRTGRTK